MKHLLLILIGYLGLMTSTANAQDLDNLLYLELQDGRVVIEMRPDIAPLHVARIKQLVQEKFYDGLSFHRVIDGFMVQTGDPLGNGTGGSGQKIKAEFSKEPHLRGTVSMARAGNDINSGDSQFFICLADARFLDEQYTAWGSVVQGMEFVDKIKKGNANNNGAVTNPDKIITLRLATEVENN
jgi:peptidylprolyl isomerase